MKFIFITIITVFLFSSINAQELKEMTLSMSDGAKSALVLSLPKTDAKEVEKSWLKYLKDFDGKTKKNKKTDEIFTDNAMIETLSKNTVDVYTSIKSKNDGSELTLWIDLGGAYLSSATHPAQFDVAEEMLEDFAQSISVGLAEEELKVQQENLEKTEEKLAKLDKNEADMKKSIADYQAKIKELEAEIQKNNEARKAQIKVVEEQRVKTEAAAKALKAVKG